MCCAVVDGEGPTRIVEVVRCDAGVSPDAPPDAAVTAVAAVAPP